MSDKETNSCECAEDCEGTEDQQCTCTESCCDEGVAPEITEEDMKLVRNEYEANAVACELIAQLFRHIAETQGKISNDWCTEVLEPGIKQIADLIPHMAVKGVELPKGDHCFMPTVDFALNAVISIIPNQLRAKLITRHIDLMEMVAASMGGGGLAGMQAAGDVDPSDEEL